MNREEFEAEYIRKYMKADPFREAKASMESLRVDDGYADQHIDLCWKVQKLLDYIRHILKRFPHVVKKIESIVEW